MSDKTRTRKPSGAIRAGRGPTATSAAAKRSGLQGKSRSRVAERKASLLRGASEEDVAATDMSRSSVRDDPAPPATSDEVQARTDQADGARGDSTGGAVANAFATDTHASRTPSGGSSGPGISGEQPAEEPGDIAARPDGAGEDATEVPRDAEAAHALMPAGAETGTGPASAAVKEAAASPAPTNTEGGSGLGSRQAPKRRTRATKPTATGTASPAPAKARRRARAGSASPQAVDTNGKDVAAGADARPPRRRRKTDGQTARQAASKPDAKQDGSSASGKSPDRKAPGRTAGTAASDVPPAAEPTSPSAPRRAGKAAAEAVATSFPEAPGRGAVASPDATPQAAGKPPTASSSGERSPADFTAGHELNAAVVPGLGFLSSLSGAPTIASLSKTHAVLNEAAEISRMSIEANMQAAEALASARSPTELLARQADSMRILADAWMRQGARISDFWLRMMRASR